MKWNFPVSLSASLSFSLSSYILWGAWEALYFTFKNHQASRPLGSRWEEGIRLFPSGERAVNSPMDTAADAALPPLTSARARLPSRAVNGNCIPAAARPIPGAQPPASQSFRAAGSHGGCTGAGAHLGAHPGGHPGGRTGTAPAAAAAPGGAGGPAHPRRSRLRTAGGARAALARRLRGRGSPGGACALRRRRRRRSGLKQPAGRAGGGCEGSVCRVPGRPWSCATMPAVSKGDGMRGLAVFISDIRNCEWRRGRGLGWAASAVAMGWCPVGPGLHPSIPLPVLPSCPWPPQRAARSAPVSRNGDALGGAARRGGGAAYSICPWVCAFWVGGLGCFPSSSPPLSPPSPVLGCRGGRPAEGVPGVGAAVVRDAPERCRGAGGCAAGQGEASWAPSRSLSGSRSITSLMENRPL